MRNQKECEDLARFFISQLDEKSIYQGAEFFHTLHRYSGSEDGEQAVDYIMNKLKEYGVPAQREQYNLYRSLPVSASLEVNSGGMVKRFNATPFVFSADAENLRAPIILDPYRKGEKIPQIQWEKRFSALRGKIVFTYDSSFEFASRAAKYGAAAIISAWEVDLVHHGTLGRVWGNPEPWALENSYARLPFAELKKTDGEELLGLLRTAEVTGTLNVKVDNAVKTSGMPIAKIPGKSEKYVLVSGHYDGWYEGMTDNGIANVSMLDMARVFMANRDKLFRGVVFAWWSGHSDGRYAGSTWYLDNHFADIQKNCVAHINMDIAGCAGSDMVGFNTSLAEGIPYDKEFLSAFNTFPPPEPLAMARFADQSFWGADVPFAIMPSFSVRNPKGPAFYWWHTPEDTLDKVDKKVMIRDAAVITKLAVQFSLLDPLPADFPGFFTMMEKRLKDIKRGLTPDFDLGPLFMRLGELKQAVETLSLTMAGRDGTDDILIRILGGLTRLVYTSGSPYSQDEAISRGQFPVLSDAVGQTPENTTAEYYLALCTAFKRQTNRIEGEILGLIEFIYGELSQRKNCEELRARIENT
jgi:aminopeptidase YwaD